MLKRRNIYFVFCSCFLVIITSTVGNAFFNPGEFHKTQGLYFQRERNYISRDPSESAFVYYDNFGLLLADETVLKITPRSDFFVSAEIFDCNVPVRIAIRRPITPENSLANLLYADLKLRQLHDEYKTLQQRTSDLLANLSVPFIEHSAGIPEQYVSRLPVYNYRRESFNINFSEQHNSLQSVHERRAEVIREHQTTIRQAPLQEFSRRSINTSLSNLNTFVSLDRQERRGERVELILSTPVEGPEGESENSGNLLIEGHVTEESRDRTAPRKKEKSLTSNKTGIPWLFRMFMKFQEYMFSNPREVIITLLSIALVVSFIFSGRRR